MLTLRVSTAEKPKIPILLFADSILGIQPYDWQCKILLNYEAGKPTAAACANFTGKTSTVFPIAALWTLYNYPRARLMYLSATSAQVKNQFFASLERFRYQKAYCKEGSASGAHMLRALFSHFGAKRNFARPGSVTYTARSK